MLEKIIQPKASGSILDRVMSSQHAAAIENFSASETFAALLRGLTEKEQDVVRRRFGLHGNRPETLEEIGKLYTVTRERIRQIENGAIKKIRQQKNFREMITPIERLLVNILTNHGGIIEEQSFFQETLGTVSNAPNEQRALIFILRELLHQRFEHHPDDEHLRSSWKLTAQSLEIVLHTVQDIVDIVTEHATPMTFSDLVTAFKNRVLYQDHASWFIPETITSYINVASQIGKNPFHEYGLTTWGSIAPKRMNDKILLILKKHGKPLHFTDIAKRINEARFDRRKAYAPTVHNELILNKEYVLVGRGIYALKAWGYRPGVVADVLRNILTESKRPLSRDELVTEVLKQRIVKRNTILLALTNKRFFQHLPSGLYTLPEPQQQPQTDSQP